MASSWTTKYGTWRVRHEPPTLSEAFAAAAGLTDDESAQVEIAASLMGVSAEEARKEAEKARKHAPSGVNRITTSRAGSGSRTVVVERMPSRRAAAR